MTGTSLVLVLTVGVLFGIGFFLLLERSLVRVVIGFVLLGHAANLALLLAGGAAGAPPLRPGDAGRPGGTGGAVPADPLPQAMALTAIVITFGVTALLLALAYRSWLLTGTDAVQDDVEDRRVAAARERADDDARGIT